MNVLDTLHLMLTEYGNKALAADCCAGVAIEAWSDLAAMLLQDVVPSADQRFGASFATANAQRQLRELADRLGDLGAGFDALLRAAAGEQVQ